MQYFLGGTDKPSIKTSVQICESQDHFSTNFQACASYLSTMVQWTLAKKQVHIAATATKVNGVKLKNREGTD